MAMLTAERKEAPRTAGGGTGQSEGRTGILGYQPGLDGVRGIALLLVFAAHLGIPPAGGGYVGVTLFFVLSGFLITRLLSDELARNGRISIGGFYRRRARRLLPALAVLVAVSAAWIAATGGNVAATVGWVALYGGNWATVTGVDLGPLSHTWSLAIEEQFYLAWPILLAVAGRRVVWVAVVGIVFAVASRTVTTDLWDAYYATHMRVDAILAGCLLAYTGWRVRYAAVAAATLVALAMIDNREWMIRYGLTFAVVVSVVLVTAALSSPRWLTARWLVWVGKRSYGLYLWHVPLVAYPLREHTEWVPGRPFVMGAVAVGLAALSYRFVESRQLSAAAYNKPRSDAESCRENTANPAIVTSS